MHETNSSKESPIKKQRPSQSTDVAANSNDEYKSLFNEYGTTVFSPISSAMGMSTQVVSLQQLSDTVDLFSDLICNIESIMIRSQSLAPGVDMNSLATILSDITLL